MSRDYPNNGYPSVTEVLNVLRKPALEMWFKVNTIKFCNDESKKGKLIGKQIHEVIEEYIRTGEASIESEYATEVSNALNSFMMFCGDHKDVKLEVAELSLTSDMYGYNGTIDVVSDGLIVDWKSANCKELTEPKIWDEWLYQVAAYVYLYNCNNSDTTVERAMIVAIAKDKIAYNKYVMEKDEIEECFEHVFWPALRIRKYQKRKKDAKKKSKSKT
jgi:hypothetical protein